MGLYGDGGDEMCSGAGRATSGTNLVHDSGGGAPSEEIQAWVGGGWMESIAGQLGSSEKSDQE